MGEGLEDPSIDPFPLLDKRLKAYQIQVQGADKYSKVASLLERAKIFENLQSRLV
jgi:hypothetical protein